MKYHIRQILEGENFCGFCIFLANRESFPLESLLCAVHDGLGLMHHVCFTVNSVLCAQPQKFSPSKVLLHTVSIINWLIKFMATVNYGKDIQCNNIVARNEMNLICIYMAFISKVSS